jgi:hypothetical protein
MPHITITARMTMKLLLLAGLLALQGCSQEIDARQARVEQGLIYKKDASDPFSGTLTNVGPNEVGREYGGNFLPFEGGCTVPVKNGMFDGLVSCKNSKGKKIAEVTYSHGHQDGAFKVWAPDTDNLMLSMAVRGGFPDGVMERYNPKSGKIISRIAYAAGKKSGEEKRWDITGETLLTDLAWGNGSQTGVFRYGENEEHYKAGVRDGIWKMCQLNRSVPPERLQANYSKAQAYYGMAEQLGGTYFLPALVDSPTGVECTEKVYKDGIEQPAAISAGASSTQDACLDAKIAAFRKENGDDAPIMHDVIEEWEGQCRK